MRTLTALVIDDEPIARRRLARLLCAMDGIEVIGEAGNVAEAVDRVRSLRPDVIFLDVHMPGGSGFDVLDKLDEITPAIVFVTAFDHYALRAFERSAMDYVTKPVEKARLGKAVARARLAIQTKDDSERVAELKDTITTLRRVLRENQSRSQPFWVKSRGEFIRVAADKVVRIEAERDYVRIFADGQSYLIGESLTSLERRLDAAEFIRVHRSVILRRDAIVRFRQTAYASLTALLSDGSEVRVGRTFAKTVRIEIGQGQ